MQAVIVIPARYGSSRFPGKPLVQIAGISLLQRVHDRVRSCRKAAHIYVATDDERIASHVRGFGGSVVMTASELPSGTDRIAAAMSEIRQRDGLNFTQIINVQGDEPLIDVDGVDAMISALQSLPIDVVTLSCPLSSEEEFRNRDVVKVVRDRNGTALYFSRAPIPHDSWHLARRHIGVYGYQSAALNAFSALPPSPLELEERLEQLRLLENGFRIHVIDTAKPHLGVDRPEDVSRIEQELRDAARG
ncbi:MAG TPA: 3-deoxy-manno-octulosonate cytidylyltransferase [Thermoanaerobaculia bacterium]|nr:3-deoxy-manno-octulosonate cytidylyltransferase [Thermoanaerobaculia bacterium]